MQLPGVTRHRAQRARPWVIVLAAGEGQRLRTATVDADGVSWPKQYCSFMSDRSLLRHTLERACQHAPPERILVVVAEEHERWWRRDLAELPEGNVVVQPSNRGTAAGVLLPLLRVLGRDPVARVLFLPSDHHIEDEGTLQVSIAEGLHQVDLNGGKLVLLGITPDRADTSLGWIVPEGDLGTGPGRVARFIEKPCAEIATRLLAGGALWNSFVFCARAGHLLDLYTEHLPDLPWALTAKPWPLRDGPAEDELREVYRTLPVADFSRDLLEHSTTAQAVLRVPRCGWTDLGTPERARQCRERGVTPKELQRNAALTRADIPDIALGC